MEVDLKTEAAVLPPPEEEAPAKKLPHPLEDGEYLSFIVVTDPRGDEYYTPVMELSVSGGEVTDMGTNSDYFVITTAD